MNVADTSTNRANFGQRLPTIPALIGSVNTSALYKGESQGKKFPSDWKERKCLLCFPAHLMLRGSGDFRSL
jgi:hypothetical protein